MKFTYGMVRSFVVARQLAARARLFQGGKFSGFFVSLDETRFLLLAFYFYCGTLC